MEGHWTHQFFVPRDVSDRSHFKLQELCDVLRPGPRLCLHLCVEDGVFLRLIEKSPEEIMEEIVYPATHDVEL